MKRNHVAARQLRPMASAAGPPSGQSAVSQPELDVLPRGGGFGWLYRGAEGGTAGGSLTKVPTTLKLAALVPAQALGGTKAAFSLVISWCSLA